MDRKPINISTWQIDGLALLRISTGLLMAYHGLEVFAKAQIIEYSQWDSVKNLPYPLLMACLGKGLELVRGTCLTIGLFTIATALLMAIDMLFICFKIGNGKFWYEEQHPFIFALPALVFFLTGYVKWGADAFIFKK